MATNTGQGTSASPTYPANSCNSLTVYTGSGCSPIVVGCTLYYDNAKTVTMPAGSYKVDIASNNKQVYTVNASGVVTAVSQCSWSSTKSYSAVYTGTKNNCAVGGTGSTITVNNGTGYSYSGNASYTSYISQADADSIALANATTAFNNGVQNYINNNAVCTFTSTKSGSCSGTYTRNNCAANCYGLSVGYTGSGSATRTSQVSQADADSLAQAAANTAACADRDANGQNYANANAGCCCWVYETYCSGCSQRSRERNSCDNSLRNDALVSASTCACGTTCGGTYWSYYCSGTTRMRELRYSCDGSYAGTTETFATCDQTNCGASTTPSYTDQGYTTCQSCFNAQVYKDTNACSGTYNQYYYQNSAGNKVLYGAGQPTGTACNTTSSCVDSGSGYCSGANYVINQTQSNSCSGASCSVRVIETNSVTYGCYTPPPSCYLYSIVAYSGFVTVSGTYTTCSGASSNFSYYNSNSSGGPVGTLCARSGTVNVTSGNGTKSQGSTCTS